MPPKNLSRVCTFKTTPATHSVNYTTEDADLVEPGLHGGTRRFQWHPQNPDVTVLDFSSEGTCELVRTVPMVHARYLWSKLIKQGWVKSRETRGGLRKVL